MSGTTYNVVDYGAVPNDGKDDTKAIQAALDAAYAAGGGTVYIPTGLYTVHGDGNPSDGGLLVRDHITVSGDGMGQTILQLGADQVESVTGIIRTPDGVPTGYVTVQNLSIDGNRRQTSAPHVIGFFTGTHPGSKLQAHDITVQNVEIYNDSGYGFDPHEQTRNLTMTNNVAHDNGLDGFAFDYQIGATISGNVSYNNDRHGFNIVTQTHDTTFSDNQAYGNGGAGVVVQRGTYNVPSPYNVTIKGGSSHDNAAQGLLIKTANYVTVDGANISNNGLTGIEIDGGQNNLIENSTISNNSTTKPGSYDGVLIRNYVDNVYNQTYVSQYNTIQDNTISGFHNHGIEEWSDGSNHDSFIHNLISGTNRAPIVVGSSTTTVQLDDTIDATKYGATPGDATDDTAAINSAIAAMSAAGGGTVTLPAGTFIVSGDPTNKSLGAIRLQSNVTLVGAGMGQTILKVADGVSYEITGVVRSPYNQITTNYGLKNLTIDGNRANTTGHIIGFYTGVAPGSTLQDSDVMVDSVEIENASGYGFDPHEQTKNLTIQNSVAHNNGTDGFVADYIVGGLYKNDVAYNNDRHGFNVTTTTNGLVLDGVVAYGNGSTGVTVQRGDFNIPVPYQNTIQNSHFYDNAREGVFLKLADAITLRNNEINGNGRSGVRLDGADDTVLDGNNIYDNSQSRNGGYDEILIDGYLDSLNNNQSDPSLNTAVSNNTISSSNPALQSAYAIYQAADGSTAPVLSNNTITGWVGGGISISADGGGRGGGSQRAIYGTTGPDLLTGTAGNDEIHGLAGNDTLVGGAGADILDGGDGIDTASYAGSLTSVSANLATGTGSGGDAEGDTYISIENLIGSEASDTLTGDPNANYLQGGGGNDTLIGGAGADTLDGGSGTDTASYAGSLKTVNSNLATGTGTGGDAQGDTYISIENLTGSEVADTLTGDGNANYLQGGGGNDTLIGGGGNDTLDGGIGSDSMAGGLGDDTYYVERTGDIVTENPGEGNDTVLSAISYTVPDNVENLTLQGTSAINGYGNALDNLLIGNGAANTLKGGAGNDTLNGGAGADTLVGGDGNDTYFVDDPGDVVTESVNNGLGGIDTVETTISYTLPANVENIILLGTANINATGNTLSNVFIGNAGQNVFTGAGGNDTFNFAKGNFGGDTITDFVGNGPNPGDMIQFSGFNSNATLTNAGSVFTVTDGAYTESFTLTGVTSSLDPSDYKFG